MSAAESLRAALAMALSARPEFSGVEGLARDTAVNALPQARVDAPLATDWSTKDKAGHEVRLTTTIRVARGQAMRLPMMAAAATAAGAALAGSIDGWAVGSAVHVGSRTVTASDGTIRAVVEHRLRVLQT